MTARRRAPALLLVAACAACSDDHPIAGRWKLDVEETLSRLPRIEAAHGFQREHLSRMLRATLELEAGGSFTAEAWTPMHGPDEYRGSWALDGDRLTLRGRSARTGRSGEADATWSGDELIVRVREAGLPLQALFRRAAD